MEQTEETTQPALAATDEARTHGSNGHRTLPFKNATGRAHTLLVPFFQLLRAERFRRCAVGWVQRDDQQPALAVRTRDDDSASARDRGHAAHEPVRDRAARQQPKRARQRGRSAAVRDAALLGAGQAQYRRDVSAIEEREPSRATPGAGRAAASAASHGRRVRAEWSSARLSQSRSGARPQDLRYLLDDRVSLGARSQAPASLAADARVLAQLPRLSPGRSRLSA